MRYHSPYDTWPVLGTGRASGIHSPLLNRRLAAGEHIAVRHGGRWHPPDDVVRPRSPPPFNESKLRLATDLAAESASVTLQQTDYAAFLDTNRLAYEQWYRDAPASPRFDDIGLRDGLIPGFEHSMCSNHLGGDVLAVGPGRFWIQRNAPGNGMFPGQYVASSSGSFDLGDVAGVGDLVTLVKRGLLRELREELGLDPASAPGVVDIRVIGYARATYLGGKPQFFGVVRTPGLRPTIRDDERNYVQAHETHHFDPSAGAQGLLDALRGFADTRHDAVAPPLRLLTGVLADWLCEEGARRWLFDRQDPTREP